MPHRRNLTAALAALTAAGAAAIALVAAAAPASAAPATIPGSLTAQTLMLSRPDSGGGGNWANDNFFRTLTIRSLGPASDPANCGAGNTLPCFEFTAALSDRGMFTTTPGALTPNQGTPFAGDHLPGRPLSGSMNGSGQFGSFYATAEPDARLVPHIVLGSNDPSSTWPELAFPDGTTFAGVSESTFSYRYVTTVRSFRTVTLARHKLVWVFRRHHWVLVTVTYTVTVRIPVRHAEQWTDSSSDNSGQVPGAGNITG